MLGPSESLYRLLDNGPITESQFAMLTARFDDPETIHHAARQLGVIRQKGDDGKVILRLPTEAEQPKRSLSEQLGLTPEGNPIVATSRDYSPEPVAEPTARQHGVNLADSPVDRHANPSSAEFMSFKAAGKLLAEHGVSIIGSGVKICRDLNDPHSRERYVRISEVRDLLSTGRGGRGAGELIEQELQKAQQQRSRERYSGKQVGAAKTQRRVIARETDPAQQRAKERAQRARAENTRKRREATASRRTGI